MSAIKYQLGDVIDFTAAADHVSGDILTIDSLTGIVVRDVADGEQGALAVEGAYIVPSDVTTYGTPVGLRELQQDAIALEADANYDGICVGVHSTGNAIIKLERGSTITV